MLRLVRHLGFRIRLWSPITANVVHTSEELELIDTHCQDVNS